MRALIIGCGYIGLPLGAELVNQGHEVTGIGRHIESRPEVRAVGIHPVNADVTDADSLRAVPGSFDWVVNCVSSSRGGIEDYRKVYLQGCRHLVDWLSSNPPQKFVYTSSTGVYGQNDGKLVKEDHVTDPTTETGRILVETERLLHAAHLGQRFPAIVLRVAGIYGPDRIYQLRRFISGEARIEDGGKRHLNMIHRDDVIGAIIAALTSGLPGNVYNVVDDEPVRQIHFLRWLSESLAMDMPPAAGPDEVKERKRGITDKMVSNRRLKMELGCPLKYPTFRQGYSAEIKRLEDAGELG